MQNIQATTAQEQSVKRHWWQFWKRTVKKPKISVLVESDEEMELYRVWAAQQECTVSDWVREQLKKSIPLEFRRKMAAAKQSGLAMEEAFVQLDYVDRLSGTSKITMPKSHEPPKALAVLNPGVHACKFFNDDPPPHLTKRDCIGSCLNSQKYMQACNFMSDAARNCPLYVAKIS